MTEPGTPQTTPDPVLIFGHGRSGTNFLLRLLDLSPTTHARNEPNELEESPLFDLPSGTTRITTPDALECAWDPAVAWTATHMGERDMRVRVAKRHHRPWALGSGLYRWVTSERLRFARAGLRGRRPAQEWPLPRSLGSRNALQRATPVLKLNQVPGWAAWVLGNRPGTRVLHIVRHPGGFLNSWRNRYLAENDRDAVWAANLRRLERVVEADPAWAGHFGDIRSLSVEASELWYWRYAAETIHAAGSGCERYRPIVYEALAADPVAEMKQIFAFCELPWSDRVEAGLHAQVTRSTTIAGAWRSALDPADVELVLSILEGSPIRSWWRDDP